MDRVGILIEEHFDGSEYKRFNEFFPSKGYAIDYLSHLWGNAELTFNSNPENGKIEHTVKVHTEIEQIDPRNYCGFILIGAYAMDRLRYDPHPTKTHPHNTPAVRFLQKVLQMPGIKVGTICHSLWLFCADPMLLKGRKVTCAHNIICDVQNAGGEVQYTEKGVKDIVIDGDLISAKHPEVLEEFLNVFIQEMQRCKKESTITTN